MVNLLPSTWATTRLSRLSEHKRVRSVDGVRFDVHLGYKSMETMA